ncbi:unnamed protein product [Adineta ricciae]|uniref:Uncharacterized protein n=1 Tax=Adineta ricciae TaxID=249248 RepID=A0A814RH40_ADIRI|nr:unnamed protein product [Adineta ricciae]
MGGFQTKFATPMGEISAYEITSSAANNGSLVSNSNETTEQAYCEPIEVLTRQKCDESVYVLNGKDGDQPAWHIILISYEKYINLDSRNIGPYIRVEDLGRNIQYRNKAGEICQASGYGLHPPEKLMKWINENYDPYAINEDNTLVYTADDIRLCTINKTAAAEFLHKALHYHRHEEFHYIRLHDHQRSTVAVHAGLKPFDRVIEYNGVNVEDDSVQSLRQKINSTNKPWIQLLLCSPATYVHYKTNHKHLHSNLDTVQLYKPVRNTAEHYGPTCGTKDFYAVCCEDDHSIVVEPLSSTHEASSSLQVYDEVGTINCKGEDTSGQVIFIGTQSECELFRSDAALGSATVVYVEDIGNFEETDTTLFVTAHEHMAQRPFVMQNNQRETNNLRVQCTQQKLIQQFASLLIDSDLDLDNSTEVHQIRCSGCDSPRIVGDRYKCLECADYDLCGRCFDQRRQTRDHLTGHIMVHFSSPEEVFGQPVAGLNNAINLTALTEKYQLEEQSDIECNVCKMNPLRGLRFKCDTCYDYNLCVNCVKKRAHDRSHPLLAMGKSRFLEIPVDDIELGDEVGRGGFGTVYIAKWLSRNRQVACKVIRVPPDNMHLEKSFRKELAAYAELSGPYVLKLYGYNIQALSDGTQKCMLIMEYMSRGNLASVLKQTEKISLRRKLEMACQIAGGMRKLHEHHMIHRDIRPENILIGQDYIAKLGDMGLARVWLPDEALTLIGCVPYMPLDFYTAKYDQSLDVYTFGLTLHHLFTETRHQFDMLTRRVKLNNVSPVFSDLIARCIHPTASNRPSANEIEITLRMHKHTIERYIHESGINYGRMSLEEKNNTFISTYDTFSPVLDKVLRDEFSMTTS